MKTKKQDQQQKRNKPFLKDNKAQCKDVLEPIIGEKFRQKVIIRKVKRQPTELQKMSVNRMSDKELVFRIYKELYNLKGYTSQIK